MALAPIAGAIDHRVKTILQIRDDALPAQRLRSMPRCSAEADEGIPVSGGALGLG
jgi:hypothetical protein